MDSGDQGVTAESPTATPEAAESGQAPSAPVAPAAQTVPYERFQQVNSQMRQFQQMAQQHGQSVQQLQRELQELKARSQAPAGTPEEQFQKQQAANALRDLMAEHPELKSLLALAKNAPHLLQSAHGVQSLRASQEQAIHRTARESIASLIKAEGLPTDPDFLEHTEDLIASRIGRSPEALARYRNGDLSVVKETFDAVQGKYFAHLRRGTTSNVIATKNNVRNLPPAPRGGGPGQEPPATLESVGGDPQKFFAKLRDAASAKLGAAGR